MPAPAVEEHRIAGRKLAAVAIRPKGAASGDDGEKLKVRMPMLGHILALARADGLQIAGDREVIRPVRVKLALRAVHVDIASKRLPRLHGHNAHSFPIVGIHQSSLKKARRALMHTAGVLLYCYPS